MEQKHNLTNVLSILDTDYASSAHHYVSQEGSEDSNQRRREQGAGQGGEMIIPRGWRTKQVSHTVGCR